MPSHTTCHSQWAQNNGLQYDQFMLPTISLKSRKLMPILTKFILKYLLREYLSLIYRHCHAHAVPIGCHKLSGDAYSHWHKIFEIFRNVFWNKFCKNNAFWGSQIVKNMVQNIKHFWRIFSWMTICNRISLCHKFVSGMSRNTSMNSVNYLSAIKQHGFALI